MADFDHNPRGGLTVNRDSLHGSAEYRRQVSALEQMRESEMKKGGWSYADAGQSTHGEMKCVACSQHITAGEYRYRQKSSKGDWYYQSQHRACSESDPVWVELDARHLQAVERAKTVSRACREFQKQWPEVDELIDYIRDDDGSEGE